MPRNLPLENLWKSKGASFREERDWKLPAFFGSPEKEYEAAVRSAVLFDLSWRGKLRVSGNDRIAFLHNLLTSDIGSLKPGEGCYSAFLTAQGKIIADMRTYVFDDHILLDCETALVPKIAEQLGRFIIMEDVLIEDVSNKYLHFLLAGPESGKIAGSLCGGAGPERDFCHVEIQILGVRAAIAKNGRPGINGYDFFIFGENAEKAAEELLKSAIPAGFDLWETLRIEAGWLRYEIDMSEEETLPETGLDALTASETKGCYPGQEVVARTNTYKGHAKKMFRLLLDSSRVPIPGDKVLGGLEDAGRITSAAYSNKLKKTVLLCYLKKKFFENMPPLKIASSQETIEAVLTPFPSVGRT